MFIYLLQSSFTIIAGVYFYFRLLYIYFFHHTGQAQSSLGLNVHDHLVHCEHWLKNYGCSSSRYKSLKLLYAAIIH